MGQENEEEEKEGREGKKAGITRGGQWKGRKGGHEGREKRRTEGTRMGVRLALVPFVVILHLSGRLLYPDLWLQSPRAEHAHMLTAEEFRRTAEGRLRSLVLNLPNAVIV